MSGLPSCDPVHRYQTTCLLLPSNPSLPFPLSMKLLHAKSYVRITRLELTAVRFTDAVLFGKISRVHFTIIPLNMVKSLVNVMKKFALNLSVI